MFVDGARKVKVAKRDTVVYSRLWSNTIQRVWYCTLHYYWYGSVHYTTSILIETFNNNNFFVLSGLGFLTTTGTYHTVLVLALL